MVVVVTGERFKTIAIVQSTNEVTMRVNGSDDINSQCKARDVDENDQKNQDPDDIGDEMVETHGQSDLLNPSNISNDKHRRIDSLYSRNISLIDMYESDNLTLSDSVRLVVNRRSDRTLLESMKRGDHNQSSSHNGLESSPCLEDIALNLSDEFQFINLSENLTASRTSIPDTSASLRLYTQGLVTPITKKTIPKLLESKFDIYGFKKSSNHHSFSQETYNNWFKVYSQYLLNRKKKWMDAMKHSGLNNKTSTRFPPKSDKMKKIIRRGIPSEYRGQAWFFYAGGYEKLNKHVGVYEKIVRDTANVTNKDTEVIERDLNRTFPDNKFFNAYLSDENDFVSNSTTPTNTPKTTNDSKATFENFTETPLITALRRVLIAFAHYQPQIGYCQSLNFLAGLLLLFMNEERTFWMLVILTERIIPKVHSANLEGVHTDQGVLMLCVKEYIPTLWSILGKNFEGVSLSEDKILSRLPPVTLVTSSWFMSLFVGILPIESVLRVWDILWYEGSKTIFRISLTILNMCLEKEEFNRSSKMIQDDQNIPEMEQIELFQFIQNYPKSLLNPNELIDNCFKKIGGYGFGSLSQDEINNCREFVSKQRSKLNDKKSNSIATELTEEERRTLLGTLDDEDVHDVYGFHRGKMSGVVWNRNISNRMKMRFTRKLSR